MTVRRLKPTDVEAEPTRVRRADLIGVELLAFDLAALHHILGERAKNGLLPQPGTERVHLADHAPLQVPTRCQRLVRWADRQQPAPGPADERARGANACRRFRRARVRDSGAEDVTTPTSLARSFVDSIRALATAFIAIEGGHFAVFMKPAAGLDQLVERVLPLTR
jgi:hypothetical protein